MLVFNLKSVCRGRFKMYYSALAASERSSKNSRTGPKPEGWFSVFGRIEGCIGIACAQFTNVTTSQKPNGSKTVASRAEIGGGGGVLSELSTLEIFKQGVLVPSNISVPAHPQWISLAKTNSVLVINK